MKLTKEECLNELEILCNYADMSASGEFVGKMLQEADDTLHQLIYEHFDNKPLKFEELKEGMWVWDNAVKKYRKLYKIRHEYKLITIENFGEMYFKENRYYRKEVKENVN